MRIDDLTIVLFYESPEAGAWSLLALGDHCGVIAANDLDPEAFYDVAGSMRCYSDRIMCFLNTGAAGELRHYVHFLIESLVSLTGGELAAEFPEVSVGADFFGQKDVLAGLFQENQTRILLQNTDSSDIVLSYLDFKGDAPEARLSPYFQHLRIDRYVWQTAASTALDEYIRVAEERLGSAGGDRLRNLVNRWKKHRSVLSRACDW